MEKYSSLRLEVTSHCPLNCTYCHNREYTNRNDDMTTEEILKLIQGMKEKYPIKKILLTGGEPLVQKDICQIIKQITNWDIKADMVSSGIMLNEDFIKMLEEAGLKRIRISIDEVGNQSDLRTSTNPNKLWKIAEMVKTISNIEVCIHTVCSPLNVDKLFEVYQKVLQIGAKRWRVFDLGYQGGITENKSKFNFDTYYDALIDSTKKILTDYSQNNLQSDLDIEINNIFKTQLLNVKFEERKINIKSALDSRLVSSPCDYVTNHQVTIRSYGVATLCQYFHNNIFDFKAHNFNVEESIKDKSEVIENELVMKDLDHCSRCMYCIVCNSGCRSRAKFLTGDVKDADPSSCYIVQRVHKEIMPLLPEDTQKVYNSFINPNGLLPKYSKKDLLYFLKERGY